jgi:hypothetical protein
VIKIAGHQRLTGRSWNITLTYPLLAPLRELRLTLAQMRITGLSVRAMAAIATGWHRKDRAVHHGTYWVRPHGRAGWSRRRLNMVWR